MSLTITIIAWAVVLVAVRIWQYDLATALLVVINLGGVIGLLLAL